MRDLVELACNAENDEAGLISAKSEVLTELKQMNMQEFCKAVTSVSVNAKRLEYVIEIRLPMVLNVTNDSVDA